MDTSSPMPGVSISEIRSSPKCSRAVPSMAQRCVSVLLDRVREITRLEQQTEKLNALGKLAGNLAHETEQPSLSRAACRIRSAR